MFQIKVISGKDQDKHGVRGASVNIEGQPHSLRTNEEGTLLVDLPIGQYKISASAPNGETGSVDLNIPEGGIVTIEVT